MDLVKKILGALSSVIGDRAVSLHEPCFGNREKEMLMECIDSTYVSSVGKFVDRFENELAAYTGVKHAVAVVNGTAALHIALRLAGVQEGEEVLIPALTFVATANAVCYCGAIPHFVDSEERTLGVDPMALRVYLQQIAIRKGECCVNKVTGRVIRAIVPMHTFGHPVDLEGLLAVARDFGLVVIEDAAESLGSFYRGKHTGSFGTLGVLSFNGNKILTTGGGGAILTNDAALASRAKHLSTTAKLPHRWAFEHDEVGYNYRLPNLNAALGCAQLERLPGFVAAKRKLYQLYHAAFDDCDGIRLFCEPLECKSNYWLQAIVLDEGFACLKEELLCATNDAGFMTRSVWKLLNTLKPFAKFPSAPLPVATSLEKRIINLPSSVLLGEGNEVRSEK